MDQRRSSLEKIRSGNSDSYEEHARLREPVRLPISAIGPAPWHSIWFFPRQTIRRIILADPTYGVWILAMFVGVSKAFIRASAMNLGDRAEITAIVIGCLVIGPLAGLLMVYVGGFLIQRAGMLFGSTSKASHVQAAIAWGSIPYIVILLQFVPTMCWLGQEMFTSSKPSVITDNLLRFDLITMRLVDLILLIVGFVLTCACLYEALKLPIGRFLATLFLGSILSFAVFFAFSYAVGYTIITTTTPPTPSFAPFAAPGTVATAPVPPNRAALGRGASGYIGTVSDFSDAFAKMKKAGYGLVVNNGFDALEAPVTSLNITQEAPEEDDDALKDLGKMQALRDLTITPSPRSTDAGRISINALRAIGTLLSLQYLDISRMSVVDSSLTPLGSLPELEELKLSDNANLRGSTLEVLNGCRKLHTLWLDGTGLTAETYVPLSKLTRIKTLHLERCAIDDQALINLTGPRSLNKLESLHLGGIKTITGKGIAGLSRLKGLTYLDVSRTKLTDADVPTLAEIKSLTTLDITGTAITPRGIEQLERALPELQLITNGNNN